MHEAVLAAGDTESGATVHFVDEGTDTGPVLYQERVAVAPEETPESLQKKVLEVEHRLLVKAVAELAKKLRPTKEEEDDDIVAMSDILRNVH